MNLLSVVVLTYNRVDVLIPCVESILASTYQNMEVIIIDNHSTDNTQEQVQLKFGNNPMVRYVYMEKNLMAAGGRNAGFRESKGDWILFIDSDNIIYPDMIEILVKEAQKDSSIGLLGPLSINTNMGNTIWLAAGGFNFFTSIAQMLYNGKEPEKVELKHRYPTYYSVNIYFVSRKAMEAVSGMDERYGIMYEDFDFGYRIRNAGFKGYIVTDARTSHLLSVGEGENKRLRELGIETLYRAFLFARNKTLFMKRHAKWYHKISYYGIFMHLFNVFYCFNAISCKRWDIARAWMKGTWTGLWMKA